jgi:hypothetical protein
MQLLASHLPQVKQQSLANWKNLSMRKRANRSV